jgi:hypothetical protein
MKAMKLFVVSLFTVFAVACGGGLEDVGVDPSQDSSTDVVPVTDENLGQAEQEVSCGWGGPPAHCLVHCCSHADWSDIGNPGEGNCTAAGNSYCANRGGNCGSCWGYL